VAERTAVQEPTSVRHPLDPLAAEEISSAVSILRDERSLAPNVRFVSIALDEPSKGVVRAFRPGDPVERAVFVVLLDPDEQAAYEATVSLAAHAVTSWREVPGVQPAITLDEYAEAGELVKAHPDYRAGLERRGIAETDLILLEAWSIGAFADPGEETRRLVWTPSWIRPEPGGNPYARPLEGLYGIVDLNRMEVLRIEDHGAVPLPEDAGHYASNGAGASRPDLRPLDVVQPEGPSFDVDGWEVRWQKWRFRIGFTEREGLVLHTLAYDDGGRVRSIAHRISYAELVIPYGDPRPGHYRMNAFDIGEYGVGELTNSLELGCDCLGEIRYFDVTVSNSRGEPYVIKNAICLHEEDAGLLWKHFDADTGQAEVRRSRRLVVSFIVTAGNYDYPFYWYLYQDGTIEAEVKLTGIVITSALAPGERALFGREVAPGLNAPNHQHFLCARLDMAVDGDENTVYEVHTESVPAGPENPHGNAFRAVATPLRTELEAQQSVDPLAARRWRIANDRVENSFGEPVAYNLLPGENVRPFALPEAGISKRAAMMANHLWVTPYAADERYPTGDYPNQHAGGAGLPEWTKADRSIEATDVVVWYVFGSHHVPRPEDWPVMPVERIGFALKPDGFFDRNPALDVPPPRGHCH
jgi:primary-amine oxidase